MAFSDIIKKNKQRIPLSERIKQQELLKTPASYRPEPVGEVPSRLGGVQQETSPVYKPPVDTTKGKLGGYQEETSGISSRLQRLQEEREKRQAAYDTRKRLEPVITPPQTPVSPREQRSVDRLGSIGELGSMREQSALKQQFEARETQASKERVGSARDELKAIKSELEPLQRLRTEQMTPEQLAKRDELTKRQSELIGTSAPFAVGAFEGALPGSMDILQSNTERAGVTPDQTILQQAEQERGFVTGKLAGTTGRQLATYALVGGALRGTQLGAKLLGGAGASAGRQIVGQQAVDLLIDTVVQTPSEYFNSVKNETGISGFAKEFALNRGLDILMNVTIGAITGDFKKARQALDTTEARGAMRVVGLDPTETLKTLDSGNQAEIRKVFDMLEESQPSQFKQAAQAETPRTPMSQRIKEVETKQFAEGDIPEFEGMTIKAGTEDLADIKPVDTERLVLTELPKRQKGDLRDFADRTYQELVSKNAPFERIGKLAKQEDIIAQAGNLNRTTGTIDYNISKAQSDMQGNDIGLSMQDIFKDVPEGEKKQYFDYMLNKHNISRMQEGKPVFGDIATSVDSSTKVAQLDLANPKLKETQKNVTNYFENLMSEWGVKSGLVSEETAQFLKDKYPDYVPTYRAVDIDRAMGGGNGNFVGNILKKAKGSEQQILPIDQQMAVLTDRTIRNARKNEIMLSLDDVFTNNPEAVSRYIKGISDIETKPITDILDVGGELEKQVTKKGSDYVINYYKNGVAKQMTVNETLYEAMKTMEQDTMDKALGVVRKYATTPFKSLITTYNPLFAVSNIMRDVPTALMYAKNPLKLISNVPEATKQMLTNGDLWKQYQALGGTRSGLFNYEKGVNLEFGGAKTLGTQLKKGAKKTGEAFESINNFTETLPRFAEYVTAMKETNNPAISLMRSAELTTDFARFGKQTKRADAVVPYLNASFQGIDKFARQLRDKPLQTLARGGVVVATPTLILDQVNKNNDAYNNMSARERNQYYHIPKEDGTFWRIPRSREVGVLFGTVFEWIARASRGEEVTSDEIMSVAMENFTPVNGFDSNILKPAGNFWKIATGKDPDAKNYFGSKIVPTSLQKYSPGQQFDENTTSISKNLGEFFNVSPKAIDYLMDSYLGVIGDVGMPYLTDKKVNPLEPFKRRFIADPVYKSESQNKFYDTLDKIRKQSNDFNQQYDIPSKIVTPLEKQTSALNKLSKTLSDLRKEQQAAQRKGDEEKSRELREEMNQVASEGVEKTLSEEELKKQLDALLKKLGK